MGQAVLDLPVARPSKLIAVGLNYLEHVTESGPDFEIPAEPVLFAKWPSCLIPSGADIRVPAGIDEIDWEGELAVIIGRRAHNVTPAEALNYVAGYTCMNDISARRVQREGIQWSRAKSFDTFGPIGPKVVSSEVITDPQSLDIVTRVNGRVMQSSNTKYMIFPVAELISFISQGTTLEPGDIISTGTPSGVGGSYNPPMFLADGDIVEVEISGIGTLTNRVVKE